MRRMWTKTEIEEIGVGGLSPDKLLDVLHGSDTIVIDEDEAGTGVEVHLDADVVSTLERALVTPLSPPAATSLVAVGTGNEQEQIQIGDGLAVTGDTSPKTLSLRLYKHEISLTQAGVLTGTNLIFISTSPTEITKKPAPGIIEKIIAFRYGVAFVSGQSIPQKTLHAALLTDDDGNLQAEIYDYTTSGIYGILTLPTTVTDNVTEI